MNKQKVNITNIAKHEHIQIKGFVLNHFTMEVYDGDVLTQTRDEVVAYKEDGTNENRNAEYRKLADDTVEIMVNGTSIGFGALNAGAGMTRVQLENSANTKEADADTADKTVLAPDAEIDGVTAKLSEDGTSADIVDETTNEVLETVETKPKGKATK